MNLIERENVLACLREKLETVSDGEGHCLFISGEAGMGKTSVVKVFCQEQRDNCTIYQGACDALFTPRPLAPLYDIIWQVNNQLWPGSHNLEERTELFASFFRELRGQKEKFVIVFEDIHWADEATMDFIRFLARRITQLHCLFILTYRDNEVSSQQTIRHVLGQIPPHCFTRIPLAPLSKFAVEKLAEEKGFDGNEVYTIAGGNPFYVTEILSSYSLGVPDSVKDAILSAHSRTDEKARQVWDLLSVVPTSFEVKYLEKFEPLYASALESCLRHQILIITDGHIAFKHELFRRTIESSLSPLKRIALNKKILELLQEEFEQAGELERIIHHAKAANENSTVFKYAPLAAREAASVGAHAEAARLYLSAIEYHYEKDEKAMLTLYQAYAYECYLTNQINEAIIYATKALKILDAGDDREAIANSFCFLSRLWWVNDHLPQAEETCMKAIKVLEPEPASKAKATAYSLLSQLKMLADIAEDCITWGDKAISLAIEAGASDILSYALGNVGSIKIRMPHLYEEGLAMLRQSLQLALQNSYTDYAGMAFTNLGYSGLVIKDYGLAKEAIMDAVPYCEENDLDLWILYIRTIEAKLALDTGDWNKAYQLSLPLVEDDKTAKIIKIFALTILSAIDMRRGTSDSIIIRLKEAKEKAFETSEPQRIIQALTAFLEYEWITGEHAIESETLQSAITLISKHGNRYGNSEFAFWLFKARGQRLPLRDSFEGFQTDTISKAQQAATLWKEKGCAYNEALALFDGSEDDKKEAISLMQALGADAVYQKMKKDMRTSGIKNIPRGLRKSTQSNPAQLTSRELEILQLLNEGLQNKEIAGKLFISTKTVEHHISSILFKLDSPSRAKAINEALRLQILK